MVTMLFALNSATKDISAKNIAKEQKNMLTNCKSVV